MKVKATQKGISDRLLQMYRQANKAKLFLNTFVLEEYRTAQKERFMTENTAKWSQGGKWKPLNPEYAEAKKKKYAKYPGGGKRMMIATGRLLAAMLVQDGQDSVKIVRNKSLIIAVKPKEDFGYWKWADKKRTVTKFKVGFYRMLAKEYVKFIRGAK